MMFLMRMLEALLGAGVIVAALSVWRLCSPSSSRSWRTVAWVVAAVAVFGATGFYWAAALKVSLRTALGGDALVNAASFVLQAAIVSGIIVLAGGWILNFIRLGIPRFRAGSTSNLKYEAVSLTVCVALLVTSLELPVQDRRRLTPEQRISELDRSLRALEDGDREMPRDTWDPDYVVNMVGRDPQRLFRWVKQNTYWIPYHGVLRGPVGVLMDRQGNSLDRAILLATLLERAGQQVRLAHGELPPDIAKELLPELVADREVAFHRKSEDQTWKTPNLQRVSAQYGFERGSIGEVLSTTQKELAKFSADVRDRANDESKRLLQVVKRPTSTAEWGQRYNSALSALTDHWWVQQLLGGNWIDRDLLQPTSKREGALAVQQTATAGGDLAADLRHQIVVRVICEQEAHGKLTEHTALEHVVPLADLMEQPIVLKFWPVDWVSDAGEARMPSSDFRKAVLGREQWVAALAVDRKLVAGGLVLANGDDPKAPHKGGAMGGFADAFSASLGIKQQDANRQLSALWIEYEIRVPGEKPRTVRRNVFDLIGPAKRSSATTAIEMDESKRLTRGLAMLMRTEMLPVSCRFSAEFLMHLASKSLIGNRAIINSALRGDFQPDAPSSEALLEHMAPVVSRLFTLAHARIEWANDPDSLFVSEPQLLTRHSYAFPRGDHITFREATDIVANSFGVSLAVPDGFAARLTQGVLDTNVEAQVQLEGPTFGNTADAYAKSGTWAHVAEVAQVRGLNLPSDSRQRISEDVSSGYEVVAPQSAVPMSIEDFSGWWRVDPSSGTALGMGGNGWGTATTEEERTNVPAVEQEPRFIRMMNAAKEGFLGGYSFCVAIKTWKTIEADKAVVHRHLIATIESPDTQRECLVEGIVSAVLSLFIVSIGPVISKWMTRSFPLAARAGKWLAGGGKPLLGGNGGAPPEPFLPGGGEGGNEPGGSGGGKPGGGGGNGSKGGGKGFGNGPDERASPNASDPEPGTPPKDDLPCDDLQSEVAQSEASQDDLVFQSSEGRMKAPFDTMEQIDKRLKDLATAKQNAEAFKGTAESAVKSAQTQFDIADKEYQAVKQPAIERLGEENYFDDPAVQAAGEKRGIAETNLGEAKHALFGAEQDLYKLSGQENHFRSLQAPTARLIQAEQQLDVSIEQGMKLRQTLANAPKASVACEPGSDLYSETAAFDDEAALIRAEYKAALDDYMDVFFDEGLPYESAPTEIDPKGRLAYDTTQPGYPNGSPGTPAVGPGQAPPLPSQQPQAPIPQGQSPPTGQQSSAANSIPPGNPMANSIPPNPMANSVVGVDGALNALGGGPK